MVIKTSESIVRITSEIEAVLKKQQYPGENSPIPQQIKTFGGADLLWSKVKAQVTIISHIGESMGWNGMKSDLIHLESGD